MRSVRLENWRTTFWPVFRKNIVWKFIWEEKVGFIQLNSNVCKSHHRRPVGRNMIWWFQSNEGSLRRLTATMSLVRYVSIHFYVTVMDLCPPWRHWSNWLSGREHGVTRRNVRTPLRPELTNLLSPGVVSDLPVNSHSLSEAAEGT